MLIAEFFFNNIDNKVPILSDKNFLSTNYTNIEFKKKIFSSKDETQKIKFLGLQFAAKEAVVKALGTGFKKPMMPNQISVLRNDEGKPIIEFDESIKSFINDLGIKSSHVSLSDDGGYAVAFVILEA